MLPHPSLTNNCHVSYFLFLLQNVGTNGYATIFPFLPYGDPNAISERSCICYNTIQHNKMWLNCLIMGSNRICSCFLFRFMFIQATSHQAYCKMNELKYGIINHVCRRIFSIYRQTLQHKKVKGYSLWGVIWTQGLSAMDSCRISDKKHKLVTCTQSWFEQFNLQYQTPTVGHWHCNSRYFSIWCMYRHSFTAVQKMMTLLWWFYLLKQQQENNSFFLTSFVHKIKWNKAGYVEACPQYGIMST